MVNYKCEITLHEVRGEGGEREKEKEKLEKTNVKEKMKK